MTGIEPATTLSSTDNRCRFGSPLTNRSVSTPASKRIKEMTAALSGPYRQSVSQAFAGRGTEASVRNSVATALVPTDELPTPDGIYAVPAPLIVSQGL